MLELGDSIGTLSYNGDCQSSKQDRLNGNPIIEGFLNHKECSFFCGSGLLSLYFLCTIYLCACLVARSSLTLCDPMDCSLPGSSVHGHSLGKNIWIGCHALFQGIFPTQELNPSLPHCRQILYCLKHQESPRIL